MDWPKVKNILIVLFAAVDIFLIGSILFDEYKNVRIPETLISDTVSIMERSGVDIDPAIIPTKRIEIKGYLIQNAKDLEQKLADKLFNTTVSPSNNEETGIRSYNMGDNSITFKNGNYVSFRGAWSKAGFDFDDKDSVENLAKSFVDMLSSPSSKVGKIETSYLAEADRYVVTVTQKIDEKDFIDGRFILVITQKGIVNAEGNWLYGTLVLYKTQLHADPINILLKYHTVKEDMKTVMLKSIAPSFVLVRMTENFILQPVWEIRDNTDTLHYFNAFTGDLVK